RRAHGHGPPRGLHAALDRRRAADRNLAAPGHGRAPHHPAACDRRRGWALSRMLVGAFACAHTPQLLSRPETEDRNLVLRVHTAFARVKGRLQALRPDAIAMVAGHHIEAFFLDAVPALGEILRARLERVVLMASGGMSHFPGTDRYASPEFDYDRRLLNLLTAGRGRELAAITAEELDRAGNIELRTWITLLGAVGDAKADVYCYEPSWHHGNAVVEWPL